MKEINGAIKFLPTYTTHFLEKYFKYNIDLLKYYIYMNTNQDYFRYFQTQGQYLKNKIFVYRIYWISISKVLFSYKWVFMSFQTKQITFKIFQQR